MLQLDPDIIETAMQEKPAFLASGLTAQVLDLGGFRGLKLVLGNSPEGEVARNKSFIMRDLGDDVFLTH